jgi:hypothetical protein
MLLHQTKKIKRMIEIAAAPIQTTSMKKINEQHSIQFSVSFFRFCSFPFWSAASSFCFLL